MRAVRPPMPGCKAIALCSVNRCMPSEASMGPQHRQQLPTAIIACLLQGA